jgi:hypothetical protein
LLRVLDVAPSRGHITAIDDEPTVLMFIQKEHLIVTGSTPVLPTAG